jgi:hypothetical protein
VLRVIPDQRPAAVDPPRLRAALTGLARRLGVAMAGSEQPPRKVVQILEKISRLFKHWIGSTTAQPSRR